jgi:hypothetical protein
MVWVRDPKKLSVSVVGSQWEAVEERRLAEKLRKCGSFTVRCSPFAVPRLADN